MAKETKNLKLHQVTRPEDDSKAFNLETILNENWEKLDSAVGDLSQPVTTAEGAAIGLRVKNGRLQYKNNESWTELGLEYEDVQNLVATPAGVITWALPQFTDNTRTAIVLCRASKDISNMDYGACLADASITKNTLAQNATSNTYTGLTNSTQYWVKAFVKYAIGGKEFYSNGVMVTFTTSSQTIFNYYTNGINNVPWLAQNEPPTVFSPLSNSVKLEAPTNPTNIEATYCTADKIDLTSIEKLKFELTLTGSSTRRNVYITDTLNGNLSTAITSLGITVGDGVKRVYELDVSAVTGLHHIVVEVMTYTEVGSSCAVEIHRVWGESFDISLRPDVTNLTSTQSGTVSWILPTRNVPYRTGIELFKATKDISNFDHATCVADGTVTKTTLGKDTINTVLSGLVASTQYWVKVFVKYTVDGVESYSSGVSTSFTATAFTNSSIFGVAIDTANSNPSTAVTYTDNAVGIIPMSGNNGSFRWGSWQAVFDMLQIKPCVLKNGAVQYYLNPNDFSKKADGTSADITSGTAGDVMIEFGKPIYWKFSQTGTVRNIRFSLSQHDSSYKALAHTVGTTLKQKIYLPAYLGYYDGTKLRSLSGKTPTVNQTIGTFRTYAQAGGSGYQQMGYYPLLMLQVLYTVFFKSLDSQTALGRGYVDGNAGATNTGGANAKGMFYGETTGKQQMKFCGIEDFYGNCYYWIDGFFSDANRNILISNQSVFNDTGTGYTNFGQSATGDINGYISDVQGGTETGFVVKATSGSTSTYYCDYGTLKASCLPNFSGSWENDSPTGAIRLLVNTSSSDLGPFLTSRLMYIG